MKSCILCFAIILTCYGCSRGPASTESTEGKPKFTTQEVQMHQDDHGTWRPETDEK